jgi:hypothetical protein
MAVSTKDKAYPLDVRTKPDKADKNMTPKEAAATLDITIEELASLVTAGDLPKTLTRTAVAKYRKALAAA